MSDLKQRDPDLSESIRCYPDLVQSLISFITEPAVVKLLEAGGQKQGELVFSVNKGEVISMKPQMEMKLGFEISR